MANKLKTYVFANRVISLRKDNRYKNLRLSVTSRGEIRVTAPKHTSSKQVEKFISSHSEWIKRTLESIKLPEKLDLSTGGIIRILDVDYKFNIYLQPEKIKVYIDEKNSNIHLFAPASYLSKHNNAYKVLDIYQDEISQHIKKQLREIARKNFIENTNELVGHLKINYNKISVKEQSSRWGSCSNKGNLNFNWKLILAPRKVFDYVVAHEVAHLIEPNHSPSFWQVVYQLHPNYKNEQKWLKQNGTSLDIL